MSYFKHPLRVALLVIIVIAMVAVGTFAYWLSPPHISGPKTSIVSFPLEFAIELDKGEFQQGENVTIRLSLKNISNETIKVTYGSWSGSMYFDFHILDENGIVIYAFTHNYAYYQSVVAKMIGPSKELTSICIWHQVKDYSASQVPRGSYAVKGLSRLFRLTAGDQTIEMTLETPTIAFTIT